MNTLRHFRDYHHWPEWHRFEGIPFCGRCLKPPSRPPRLQRLVPIGVPL